MSGTARPIEVSPWLRMGPCTPAACVSAPVVAAGPLRRAGRLVAACLVLLAGVPISLAIRRTRTAWRTQITRTWARLLLRALGIRFRTAGAGSLAAPSGKPGTLLVANHISWLDPLVLAATVPARPLAKREIGEWPLIRGLAAGSAVRPATLCYLEGESVSTRGCYVGDDSLLASLLRVVATRRLVVEVALHPQVEPVPTGRRHEARVALARIAEARVRAGVAGVQRERLRTGLRAELSDA
ncbi:hypothetical protein [Nonomuraea sp. NPDC048916]|uniref:lysophospholipid acyltransferase family protein n=1 Tax=Nonomuraea sp. NPDC048916 TaxID=3154232 RepID=UPI0033DC8007